MKRKYIEPVSEVIKVVTLEHFMEENENSGVGHNYMGNTDLTFEEEESDESAVSRSLWD